MEAKIEDVDAWVVARIGALERANRRLWIGVAASFTTLVSLGIAAAMFAAHLELPGGVAPQEGGSLRVEDLEVRHALRVVDGEGRTLISLGRDEKPETGASQAVLALFAGERAPQQTIRLATSSLGSALSLSSLDGGASSSLFAGASGVSLELRRGQSVRTLSELREPAAALAAAPAPPAVAASKPSAAARGEAEALAARSAGDGAAVVDLTNPTLQAVGSGFLVGPSSVTDSAGGLRLRGRIVNATSVDQSRAEFRIALGSREVSFTIARVSAGSSAPFAVELQTGGKADVRAAHMRWVRSSVAYGEE
ncbi:MAG TPA: hypothetical protein VEI82_00905 [Myxococcota bacterium]|nr:hypothetical protein [Myxococcota bacterium]